MNSTMLYPFNVSALYPHNGSVGTCTVWASSVDDALARYRADNFHDGKIVCSVFLLDSSAEIFAKNHECA